MDKDYIDFDSYSSKASSPQKLTLNYQTRKLLQTKGKSAYSTIEKKPYTKQNTIPKKYYELGGLGANIGTDAWNGKKSMLEKRLKYANNVK